MPRLHWLVAPSSAYPGLVAKPRVSHESHSSALYLSPSVANPSAFSCRRGAADEQDEAGNQQDQFADEVVDDRSDDQECERVPRLQRCARALDRGAVSGRCGGASHRRKLPPALRVAPAWAPGDGLVSRFKPSADDFELTFDPVEEPVASSRILVMSACIRLSSSSLMARFRNITGSPVFLFCSI